VSETDDRRVVFDLEVIRERHERAENAD